MRRGFYIAFSLVILGVLAALIYQKETLLRAGRTVFLEQAPVDPRSLMQGDYMVIRYALGRKVRSDPEWKATPGGKLVLSLDAEGVGHFVRFHHGEALEDGEFLLRYRRRKRRLRIGAESFFFQEGKAEQYSTARYSELKVAPSGQCILVGLRGEDLKKLGPLP